MYCNLLHLNPLNMKYKFIRNMRKRFLKKLLKLLEGIYHNMNYVIKSIKFTNNEKKFYCPISLADYNEILNNNKHEYYFRSDGASCKYNALSTNPSIAHSHMGIEKSIIIGVRLDPYSNKSSNSYYPGCSTFKLYGPIYIDQIFFLKNHLE